MAIIFEVKGANEKEELERHEAFTKLNDLSTKVLTRLAEVSESPKARKAFDGFISFAAIKKSLGM